MTIKSLTVRRVVVAVAVGASAVALAAPAVAERGPITDVAAVRAQLDLMTSADRIPGALAEVRDGRGRSVTMTSGTAELGTDRAMVDGDGRFRIASVTKPFTAVAVLQLVARNQVRLDAPVETYLPGVVRGTGAGSAIDRRDITVRQLLQHSSGLPDYVRFVDPAERNQPVEAAELVRIASSHQPDFAPGQGWKYSNTGYVLAGMIVERVTHKDIGTAVTELVIRPVHLRDTYWPPAGGAADPRPARAQLHRGQGRSGRAAGRRHRVRAFLGRRVRCDGVDAVGSQPVLAGAARWPAAAKLGTGPDANRRAGARYGTRCGIRPRPDPIASVVRRPNLGPRG
ncbi:serine hydrolase domain-containing protein [Amycolatopsis magusensis]|uniref:serine hydrolase domain-containing protein n=1 Tax=Amycolatopsis magusensis TaxID=882444 RepID=UPI0037BB247C